MCVCLLMIVFVGCGAQIPDMSEEERKEISEYAVDLLLKYDNSRPSRLVETDEEQVQLTPEPAEAPAPTETPTPEETPIPEETEEPQDTSSPIETPEPEIFEPVEETLLLPEGVTLIYNKYETNTHFVDETDGYQILEAEDGKELLIIRFSLLNSSNTVLDIDMMQDNIVYKVILGDEVVNGMITMVGNDLTTYIGSLQPDESEELVMFAESQKEILQTAETIKVEFLRQDMVSEIVIK